MILYINTQQCALVFCFLFPTVSSPMISQPASFPQQEEGEVCSEVPGGCPAGRGREIYSQQMALAARPGPSSPARPPRPRCPGCLPAPPGRSGPDAAGSAAACSLHGAGFGAKLACAALNPAPAGAAGTAPGVLEGSHLKVSACEFYSFNWRPLSRGLEK